MFILPDGTWGIKTNDELRQRMKQEDIIKFIKSQRLRWVAHVMRLENTRTARKITEWKPHKTRPVGRSRLRWMDQVEEDLRRMKITGWMVKLRIDKCGIELSNRPRPTQGCRVNRRRRIMFILTSVTEVFKSVGFVQHIQMPVSICCCKKPKLILTAQYLFLKFIQYRN